MACRIFSLAVILTAIWVQPCMAQRYTRQGAAVGGVAGAVIGGLLGKQNDRTTGGALIGGALGAVAGGVMGQSTDQEMARQRYFYEHAIYSQQQQMVAQQVAQAQTGCSGADWGQPGRCGCDEPERGQ
jgi:outer membrane lipoprotein SlyB